MPVASRDVVVLLGAARSGTKLVRDILGAGVETRVVPYDVNYVWRHRVEHVPHDALGADQAIAGLGPFVLQQLDRMAVGAGTTVIEKTVSNVLRIGYVLEAVPHARFVYLERDGADVVESTLRCWQEPPDSGRLVEKLRTFPWASAPGYAIKYATSAARRIVARDRVSTWGPRYPGMDEDLSSMSLLDVCARQWVSCVAAFERDQTLIPGAVRVRYEDLVRDPAGTAGVTAEALGLDAAAAASEAARTVRPDRVGQARRSGTDLTTVRRAIDRARADLEV
jgi:hypothetical protein